MSDSDTIWIESTRDRDGKPICLLTVGPVQCYPTVQAVRATAVDLVSCAAYAEMMMQMVAVGLPPEHVSAFTTDLLHRAGRRRFGDPSTLLLMPAGSSKRRQPLVTVTRGKSKGMLSPAEARDMALGWLEAAEATESDQLVTEALHATGIGADQAAKVFGYLRELRTSRRS